MPRRHLGFGTVFTLAAGPLAARQRHEDGSRDALVRRARSMC